MKPIKEIIEDKYSKEFFQRNGRKWWDALTPEQKEERIKKLRKDGKKGGRPKENLTE